MDHLVKKLPITKSREALGILKQEDALPVTRLGTTYTMAQQTIWLNQEYFGVGRWDGTISIFDKTESTSKGALITTALSTPADQGIQMLGWLANNKFVSSNDSKSIVVWSSKTGDFQDVEVSQTLTYDASYGIANCSTAVNVGNSLYFVTGHENGYVLIWEGSVDGVISKLITAVDLTSKNPVNPWGLQNIRGVSWFLTGDNSAQIATGSENGEICIVDVPSGKVLSRTVFNPNAQRGINAISTSGQNLLVANCSVGSEDKNLWYYWIDKSDWSVTLKDAKNLIVDTSRQQVFNFDVGWAFYQNGLCFFSATEEGELWMGSLTSDQKLTLIGHEDVAVADLGAAIAAGTDSIVYAAYNITSFKTYDNKSSFLGDPNRADSETR